MLGRIGAVSTTAAIVLLSTSGAASAQDLPPRLTASIAFGQARPLVSEDSAADFVLSVSRPKNSAIWSVDIQFRATRHLIVEAAVANWQVSQSQSLSNVKLADGTNGPSFHEDFSFAGGTRDVVLNAIATTSLGRVRLSSGAGIGYFHVWGSYSDVTDLGSSSGGGALSTAGIQGSLDVTVRVTRRIQAFGTYRLNLPFTPGFAEVNFIGGVRFVVAR